MRCAFKLLQQVVVLVGMMLKIRSLGSVGTAVKAYGEQLINSFLWPLHKIYHHKNTAGFKQSGLNIESVEKKYFETNDLPGALRGQNLIF